MLDGAVETLTAHGIPDDRIDVAWVPGAFEIPTVASRLASAGRHVAILCLGAVIRGQTTHDQHINRAVSMALAQLGVQYKLPVMFGILTCETLEQAIARSGGQRGDDRQGRRPGPLGQQGRRLRRGGAGDGEPLEQVAQGIERKLEISTICEIVQEFRIRRRLGLRMTTTMRPRTFAREIAFQVLYREDLNPDQPGAVAVYGDALLDQGRQTRELMEFVRHLAELRDQEDAIAGRRRRTLFAMAADAVAGGVLAAAHPGRGGEPGRVGREDRRRGRELERRADGRHRSQPLAAGRLRDPLHRHARSRS